MYAIQTFSGWLTAGLLIGAITFWWWSTRYLSDMPNSTHALIIRGGRFITLVGIALLFSDFQVQWTERQKIPPGIAVFVDNSESLARFDNQVRDSVTAFREFAEASDENLLVNTLAFSNEINAVGNSGDLDFSGDRTNLSGPLQYISENKRAKNLQAALIISDGIHNSGPEPQSLLESRLLPVFTLFIGDTAAAPDIEIAELRAPAYAYAGDSVETEIILGVQNLADADTIVIKITGQSITKSKSIALSPGDYTKNVSIPVQIAEAGDYQLTAMADTIPGETNTLNNSRVQHISVQPDRYTVFLLGESPSLETRFLLNAIQNLNRFEVIPTFTNRNEADSSYEKSADADIIYVLGNALEFRNILSNVEGKKLIYQVDTEGRFFQSATNDRGNTKWTESGVTLARSGENPLKSLQKEFRFDELAPVWTMHTTNKYAGVPVLVTSPGNVPVITRSTESKSRAITIFARDLWRWTFAAGTSMEDMPADRSDPYKQSLEQLFYWLLRDTDFQRLRVEVNVGGNNRIQASAQVFTSTLAQADVARVWGELLDSTGTVLQRNLYSRQGEHYQLQVNAKSGGSYRLRTLAYTAQDTMEHLSSPVKIPELNYELLDNKGQPGVLRNISEQTRGMYLQQITDFPIEEFVDRAVSYQSEQHTFALRRAYWFWALLVLLFGIDWWLRRRNGIL